jgi:ABC-type sugar transport system permease subunit
MWKWILNPSYGVLNAILYGLGIIQNYQSWFLDPISALLVVILVDSWMNIPFSALVLHATLQTIPPELYDAAKVDGANVWTRFRHMTLPLIRPGISITLIFTTIWAFRAFDEIYVLTAGGPGYATTVLNWFVYEISFRDLHLGQGSALGLILAAIIAVFTFLYVTVVYKEVEY